jgi:hypothetical protein
MRLTKVEYEFFDFEEPSASAVELGRQVRLHFADAPTLFLSWTWERQYDSTCQPYTIGRSPDSFFRDEPAAVVDASTSASWSRHLGHDVEVRHCRSTLPTFADQVIEVRSGSESTFVFSLGQDKVGVSVVSPVAPKGSGGLEPQSGNTA